MIRIYYRLNELAKFANSKELKCLLLTDNFLINNTHQRIVNEKKIVIEYPDGERYINK